MKNICCILITTSFLIFVRIASAQELIFDDFNDQDYYNNFSGDYNKWENSADAFHLSFVTTGCHSGACLKVDYSVPSGVYGGIWNSLIGKIGYKNQTLNFTDLYGALKNSSGNSTDINNVQITGFSFWAKGNGAGAYNHTIKLEFKDNATPSKITEKYFTVPNVSTWTKYSFSVSEFANPAMDLTNMKEVIFVVSDNQNEYRTSYFFLDDLSFTTTENTYDATGWSDDTFLDLVTHRGFDYFMRFTDTRGFALDRSTYSDQVSVGAIGFQLAALCVGDSRGWADGLADKTKTILQNLNSLSMGPDAGTVNAGYKGFYYHFLDATTGTRKDTNTELSLYDTMLLMYGVLSAKQCFPGDSQIQTLAQTLYDRVEWDWMVDPSNHQFYLGWSPESGFLGHVDGYTDEALLVDVLGLGSGTHPTTLQTYNARSRPVGTYPFDNPHTFAASWTGSLFNYFFAAGWLDLIKLCDRYPVTPLNIWENNRRAIEANRTFCIDYQDNLAGNGDDFFATYGQNSWGLTAADNFIPNATAYYAFGALPTQQNIGNALTKAPHVGTIAVYGAGGSMPFLPQESIAALRNYYTNTTLWSPLFGFGDSFSTDPHYFETDTANQPIFDANNNLIIHPATWLNGPWVNHILMGINIGPMLLSIENYRSGLIWDLTAANANVQNGVNAIFTDTDNDEDGYCGVVDCNDNDPNVSMAQTWFRDADDDGYSDGVTTTSCTRPSGYKLASELLASSGDCDDGNPGVYPGTIWYYDADGDGYGNPVTGVQQCTTPGPYYVLNSSDCKDDDPNIYTGSPDVRTTGGGINYYASLQSAYSAASEGSTLQSREVLFAGGLNFNINKRITLAGGYDCAYTMVGGKSKVDGLMTITRGTVIISNFELH